MKTVKDWLDELPQPYRFEAINNVINDRGAKALLRTSESLSDALKIAFYWDEAPEGANYWRHLFAKIRLEELKKSEDENN